MNAAQASADNRIKNLFIIVGCFVECKFKFFLCINKKKDVENRHLIASFVLVGVDGFATAQINLLRLTPFRSARRGGFERSPQV